MSVDFAAADHFAELRRDFPQPDSSDHMVALAYLALRDRLHRTSSCAHSGGESCDSCYASVVDLCNKRGQEIARLKEALSEAEGDLQLLRDPMLSDMRLENGQLDIGLVGASAERLASIMCAMLMDAPNYKELQMRARSKVLGDDLHFTMTIQKDDGKSKTPHELRAIAERRANLLQEALAHVIDYHGDEQEWVAYAKRAIAKAKKLDKGLAIE